MAEGDSLELTGASTHAILTAGGTMLGTSRYHPSKRDGATERVLDTLARDRVGALGREASLRDPVELERAPAFCANERSPLLRGCVEEALELPSAGEAGTEASGRDISRRWRNPYARCWTMTCRAARAGVCGAWSCEAPAPAAAR